MPKKSQGLKTIDAMLDVAASVKFKVHNIDKVITPGKHIPARIILRAFRKRLDYLEKNPNEIPEAIGLVDFSVVEE